MLGEDVFKSETVSDRNHPVRRHNEKRLNIWSRPRTSIAEKRIARLAFRVERHRPQRHYWTRSPRRQQVDPTAGIFRVRRTERRSPLDPALSA